MSQSTRDPAVSRLSKINRHCRSVLLISSQNSTDIMPGTYRNLDYLLIFKGFRNNIRKLQDIHLNMDLSIDFPEFLQLYNDATEENFNFLWCSRDSEYRKNFNKRYVIKEE
jgi:hypothetical protein